MTPKVPWKKRASIWNNPTNVRAGVSGFTRIAFGSAPVNYWTPNQCIGVKVGVFKPLRAGATACWD